jgi:hypothetical protein
MKLDELLGAKSALSSIRQGYEDDPLSQPVTRYMTGLGFKLLSSDDDSFSRVYGEPTGRYVVKVFTVEDLGYLHFLEFCKRYGQSPHLPQFYGGRVDLTKHTGVPVYAVRMENLEPVHWESEASNRLQSLVWAIRDVWGKGSEYFVEEYGHWFPKSLIEVVHALIHEARNTDASIRVDLHSRNYMQRNGTIVIVDPYAPTTYVDVDYW